jgi:hypothetical protein
MQGSACSRAESGKKAHDLEKIAVAMKIDAKWVQRMGTLLRVICSAWLRSGTPCSCAIGEIDSFVFETNNNHHFRQAVLLSGVSR